VPFVTAPLNGPHFTVFWLLKNQLYAPPVMKYPTCSCTKKDRAPFKTGE